ncbi:hypothetical protein HETAERIA_38 [Mycobacterium phage Hetaeria]|uniref:DUF7172 domain-containing protein n=1 Tax=Mycobacterium phage Hetaeria TaxID=1700833 RepID=A0A0K2FII6_9CAUD|nr:hypothetical protein HETAERIA_38 [Mycobacterium phage Hetaeria]AXH67133.1 hypothetical protein SEA_UACH1_38 [Mycobacterium phage UAch1]
MTSPDCIDPDHFRVTADGGIEPQPWMQWRHVRSIGAAGRSGTYAVTGGGNKNVLIHGLQVSYTNDTPVPQAVYGKITRGGCRVALQARSRAYLQVASGYQKHASDPGKLEVSSRMGCGADIGRGGTLGIGTQFCVIEQRQGMVTIPLAPERAGWLTLAPGEAVTARVEVKFVSEFWENTNIDGGASGSTSGYDSGATQLDLFAVPVL